jgi:hypothetical protein
MVNQVRMLHDAVVYSVQRRMCVLGWVCISAVSGYDFLCPGFCCGGGAAVESAGLQSVNFTFI